MEFDSFCLFVCGKGFLIFVSLTSRVANNQQRPCRNSQELAAATVARLVEKANMLCYGDFGGLLAAERGEDEREKREHLDLGRMPEVVSCTFQSMTTCTGSATFLTPPAKAP